MNSETSLKMKEIRNNLVWQLKHKEELYVVPSKVPIHESV